ncbi:MAG: apolipoprotein N-acyltransferase [Pyrinomonadaceae bacterium]|nr:apolipoprotein N-acyltransferase [Pyrinomonadaceae bacterium]
MMEANQPVSTQTDVKPNMPDELKNQLEFVSASKLGRYELPVGLGLGVLSGILWFLACPKFNLWPLAWFAMAPGLFAMERASSRWRAALFAWCMGIVGNAGGFYWMIAVIERFAGLPRPLAVLLFIAVCSFQALGLLFLGWILHSIRRNFDLPLALLAPLIMVTAELCMPLLFQFYLAMTLARQLHFIQIADLTGPLGVTALLIMVNGAIYDIVTNPRRRLRTALVSALIVAGVLAYGYFRINQMSRLRAAAPKIKVGIIQPNVSSNDIGNSRGLFAYQQIATLQKLSAELEAAGADLIVWPESAYPEAISRQAEGDKPEQSASRIRRNFTAPLIFNVITYEPTVNRRPMYNTAFMLDQSGKFAGRFDKNQLLIFGEYFPFLETFPWLQKFAPQSGSQYAAGQSAVAFPFRTKDGREWRLGPMICLEDIIPAFGRKVGKLHPHLLVNLTNDSWFGDTSEPWQHLSLSVFRSIEHRTELVRAVQTGVSAYVDVTGKIYAETYVAGTPESPRPPDKILQEVALIEGGHTVYAAVGDIFGYLCAAMTIFLWLIFPRLRRRRKLIPSAASD